MIRYSNDIIQIWESIDVIPTAGSLDAIKVSIIVHKIPKVSDMINSIKEETFFIVTSER